MGTSWDMLWYRSSIFIWINWEKYWESSLVYRQAWFNYYTNWCGAWLQTVNASLNSKSFAKCFSRSGERKGMIRLQLKCSSSFDIRWRKLLLMKYVQWCLQIVLAILMDIRHGTCPFIIITRISILGFYVNWLIQVWIDEFVSGRW